MSVTTIALKYKMFCAYQPIDIIEKPYWADHCDHGIENWAGSFAVLTGDDPLKADKTDQYDVHVHTSVRGIAHICIRYGAEAHEYLSCGPAERVIARLYEFDDKVYRTAAELVLSKYHIALELRTND